MSNLNAGEMVSKRFRQAIRSQLNYEEVCAPSAGEMVISGLNLPEAEYDVLAKIWSSVKKRIEETYHVSITGLFDYKSAKDGYVTCQFYLNYAPIEGKEAETKEYEARFVDTFHLSMLMFEEAIENFVLDPQNGFDAYCQCIESITKYDAKTIYHQCEKMLNDFLMNCGFKKPRDEEAKSKITAARAKYNALANI